MLVTKPIVWNNTWHHFMLIAFQLYGVAQLNLQKL